MKPPTAQVELLSHVGHRAVARASVSLDGDSETVEHELDLTDGSRLAEWLRTQRSQARLDQVRSELAERVQHKALTIAREAVAERSFTTEEQEERTRRQPMQPKSPALAAKYARIDLLCAAIDEEKARIRGS